MNDYYPRVFKIYPGFNGLAQPSPYDTIPASIYFGLLFTVSLTNNGPPESP